MYAASVARAIKQLRNGWALEGIGGSEMLKAGVKLLRYTTPFSAFGFWSALQTSVRFWALTAWQVRSVLMSNPPDLFVPVDLGALNRRLLLPLAEKGVKVFYFVPPSFWGVNPERLRKYAHPNIVFAPIYQWQSEKLSKQARKSLSSDTRSPTYCSLTVQFQPKTLAPRLDSLPTNFWWVCSPAAG